MKHLTAIPFSGFYESSHNAVIDDAIESYFQDENGEPQYPDNFWENFSYGNIFKEYAKLYCDSFNDWFNELTGLDIKLEFESLESPKYYNYSTDRIFANISTEDLKKLNGYVQAEVLAETIKNRFTSYDGFISSYSNNIEDWLEVNKPLVEYDHNEIETLFQAIIAQEKAELIEWELMEKQICNYGIGAIVEKQIALGEGANV